MFEAVTYNSDGLIKTVVRAFQSVGEYNRKQDEHLVPLGVLSGRYAPDCKIYYEQHCDYKAKLNYRGRVWNLCFTSTTKDHWWAQISMETETITLIFRNIEVPYTKNLTNELYESLIDFHLAIMIGR